MGVCKSVQRAEARGGARRERRWRTSNAICFPLANVSFDITSELAYEIRQRNSPTKFARRKTGTEGRLRTSVASSGGAFKLVSRKRGRSRLVFRAEACIHLRFEFPFWFDVRTASRSRRDRARSRERPKSSSQHPLKRSRE